jgi:hypothetical protein
MANSNKTDEFYAEIKAALQANNFSNAATAKALGLHPDAIRRARRRLAHKGWAPEFKHGLEVPEGFVLKGVSTDHRSDGSVIHYWNKSTRDGLDPEQAIQLPDPKKITKTATLYNADQRVINQWVTEKAGEAEREKLWEAAAAAFAKNIEAVVPTSRPEHATRDLLAAYPVGDHHVGMYSWIEETGANYDLDIAERLLASAMSYLVALSPPCKTALVAVLGDFLHYDSQKAVTPEHGNLLDADGRSAKMVETGVNMLILLIDTALAYHEIINVILEPGNHDPHSTTLLVYCLKMRYRDEPRVVIDTKPGYYHYFEFGNVLIGTHHGHLAKMEQLPLIMATDQSQAWGRTTHRHFWTGHVHHQMSKSAGTSAKDFAGCTVESFRILAAPDGYAHGKGYRPIRDMKSIIFHRENGEVARHTFNPAMFDMDSIQHRLTEKPSIDIEPLD